MAPTAKPVVKQDDETTSEPALVEIDLDELEADRRDEAWQSFLKRAKAYRQELRQRGQVR